MPIFGRNKGVDTDELQEQLQEKQEQLRKQLEEFSQRDDKNGGGGRFAFGLLLGGLLGAGVLYFLDPEKGEERRQTLMGMTPLGGGGMEEQVAKDQMVTGRVETELFRDATVPKGQVTVNTVDGVVYLRGTASSQEQIAEIEQRIKRIEGVEAVINLLRLPTTAAR